MYSKPFYITENIGNNSLSFEKRAHLLTPSLLRRGDNTPKLYVPNLIKINSFDEIKLLKKSEEKITFQDFGFDGKLSTNFGLENFYEINSQPPYQGAINCPIYLFDNHNHALFFWYLAKENQMISEKNNILYHIDEHADYRNPDEKLEKTDLKSIFEYTNFSKINVGNYILPAEKQGLIGKTIQIRNTKNLEDYLNSPLGGEGIILNLDLDFFQPDLDFIDYELKKKVVLDIAKKADVITVSTSPFFINQELALKVFKDLFYK